MSSAVIITRAKIREHEAGLKAAVKLGDFKEQSRSERYTVLLRQKGNRVIISFRQVFKHSRRAVSTPRRGAKFEYRSSASRSRNCFVPAVRLEKVGSGLAV